MHLKIKIIKRIKEIRIKSLFRYIGTLMIALSLSFSYKPLFFSNALIKENYIKRYDQELIGSLYKILSKERLVTLELRSSAASFTGCDKIKDSKLINDLLLEEIIDRKNKFNQTQEGKMISDRNAYSDKYNSFGKKYSTMEEAFQDPEFVAVYQKLQQYDNDPEFQAAREAKKQYIGNIEALKDQFSEKAKSLMADDEESVNFFYLLFVANGKVFWFGCIFIMFSFIDFFNSIINLQIILKKLDEWKNGINKNQRNIIAITIFLILLISCLSISKHFHRKHYDEAFSFDFERTWFIWLPFLLVCGGIEFYLFSNNNNKGSE